MIQDNWTAVDAYFAGALLKADPVLDECLQANGRAGLPPYDVSPLQGKFLHLIAKIQARERFSRLAPWAATVRLARSRIAVGWATDYVGVESEARRGGAR